jgi:predicted MFS family arabinose efflux permease
VTTIASDLPDESPSISSWMTFLLALSCGVIVANVYYAQPLIGPIAAELGLSPKAAGLIMTMTQIGFGIGLLLIVPLGDLIENRRLVLSVMALGALALASAALATHMLPFFVAALCVGLGSVTVQILIPYAGHLAPEQIRGRVIGNITTGLMLGIMLARPVSSFIASMSSWHTVYALSAAVTIVLALVLYFALPARKPVSAMVRCSHRWCTWRELHRCCSGARCIRLACSGHSSCSGPQCPWYWPAPTFTCRRPGSPYLRSPVSEGRSYPRLPVALPIVVGPSPRRYSPCC